MPLCDPMLDGAVIRHLERGGWDRPRIEQRLHFLREEARSTWPSLCIDDQVLGAALWQALAHNEDASWVLDKARIPDLCFAVTCLHGEPKALELFATMCRDNVTTSMVPRASPSMSRDDVHSIVLGKLLVADGAQSPRLATYVGRCSLRRWLQVVIRRVIIDLRRADSRFSDCPGVGHSHRVSQFDPELQYMEKSIRRRVRAALLAAVAELSTRDRTVLRYSLGEAASSREIARIYRVHRATVDRWLVALRRRLAVAVRRGLATDLALDQCGVDSILRSAFGSHTASWHSSELWSALEGEPQIRIKPQIAELPPGLS